MERGDVAGIAGEYGPEGPEASQAAVEGGSDADEGGGRTAVGIEE